LNKKIMLSEGKLNPGTTADLTACIIFIGLLFNLIEKS